MRILSTLLPVVLCAVGCTTTVTSINDHPAQSSKGFTSILDSKLKRLEDRAEDYPRRADLQAKIAGIHFQKEDLRESANYLKKAIYLDPNHVRYYFDLGRVQLQMGEIEEAEESFQHAVEIGGDKRWSGLYAAHGYTLCRLRKWDEAKERFETCVRIDRKDPTPYYFLGAIADIGGDAEETVRYMRLYLENGGRLFRRRSIEILGFRGVKVDEMRDLFGRLGDGPASNEMQILGPNAFLEGAAEPKPVRQPPIK